MAQFEKPDIEGESFKTFLEPILEAAISPELVEMMLVEPALENYFRRAFTHKTFALNRPLGKSPKFDYEVIEKIGDGVLKAAFQLWLFEIMGTEVTTPQIYSDMEKRLTGTTYLSKLTEVLGFSRWIQVTEGSLITDKIKEDVFESFVAAIVLAADKYAMKDIGFSLAKRWIYQVYNTHTRDMINPRDPRSYTDFRSQINDIWQFHGWGTPFYRQNTSGAPARSVGAQAVIEVSLMGSKKPNFPERFRDRVLGNGSGFDVDMAREAAAQEALETIGANYPDLRGFEIQLATGDPRRFGEVIANDPELLADVTGVLASLQNVYQAIAIRKLRVYNTYGIQLRVQDGGIWRSSVRSSSNTSYDDALVKAFKAFVDNFKKRGNVIPRGEAIAVATAQAPTIKVPSAKPSIKLPSGGRGKASQRPAGRGSRP